MRTIFIGGVFFACLTGPGAWAQGLPLQGEAAEEFLLSGEVVAMKPIGVGITLPMKVTLTDGRQTHHAVWKTIDDVKQGIFRSERGNFQANFRDSYKFEIAAYELDKLLQLGLVPPTVFREIDGRKGSLQLWVEDAFTELERREKSLLPEDYRSWSDQMYNLKLLHHLVFNADRRNVRNVIYDPEFRIYAIDNSRSFRRYHHLEEHDPLVRFSRRILDRLAVLDRESLETALGAWLEEAEIEALLVRRDLLIDVAEDRAALYGEEAVYFP